MPVPFPDLKNLRCIVFVYSQHMPVPFPDVIREKSSRSPFPDVIREKFSMSP